MIGHLSQETRNHVITEQFQCFVVPRNKINQLFVLHLHLCKVQLLSSFRAKEQNISTLILTCSEKKKDSVCLCLSMSIFAHVYVMCLSISISMPIFMSMYFYVYVNTRYESFSFIVTFYVCDKINRDNVYHLRIRTPKCVRE